MNVTALELHPALEMKIGQHILMAWSADDHTSRATTHPGFVQATDVFGQ